MDNERGFRELPLKAHYSSKNTIEICKKLCFEKGYLYAGVQYSKECFCGNNLPRKIAPKQSDCNMDCSGDKFQKCGGGNRMNVYKSVNIISSVQGEWTQHGHPKDAFAALNAFRKNKKGEKEQKGKDGIFNFWLLPDGATNKGFIVDLGVAKPLNLVQLVNTHTANWRDRSTKQFKVYVR